VGGAGYCSVVTRKSYFEENSLWLMTGKHYFYHKLYPLSLESHNFAADCLIAATNFMWNQCMHFHQNMIQTTLNYSHEISSTIRPFNFKNFIIFWL